MAFEKNDLMGLVGETPLMETELAFVVVRGARGGPMIAGGGCQYAVEKGSIVFIDGSDFD